MAAKQKSNMIGSNVGWFGYAMLFAGMFHVAIMDIIDVLSVAKKTGHKKETTIHETTLTLRTARKWTKLFSDEISSCVQAHSHRSCCYVESRALR